MRAFAVSSSDLGVFCAFLMNPCSKTICPSITVNSTLAIRPSRWLRTSHRSFSIFRTIGIPKGQPNWTSFMSVPMILRSSSDNSRRNSRTGSFPASERKNFTDKIGSPMDPLYQNKYVCQVHLFQSYTIISLDKFQISVRMGRFFRRPPGGFFLQKSSGQVAF